MKLWISRGILMILVLFLNSCQNEGCMNPLAENYDPNVTLSCDDCCDYEVIQPSAEVRMELKHLVAGSPLDSINSFQIDGRMANLTRARWYISNGALNEYPLAMKDGYAFISNSTNEVVLGTVPPGNYSIFKLDLGVQPDDNHKVPNAFGIDHPLSPKTPDMFWNVNDGHIFLELWGEIDTSSTPDGVPDTDFMVQFGGDSLLQTLEFPATVTIGEQFTGRVIIKMEMDYAQLLEGISYPNVIWIDQSNDVELQQIAVNIPEALELH